MFWPGAGFFPTSELLRNRFRAEVIEPHTVDNRFLANGTENTRRRISRLRMPRRSAQFGETESHRFPGRQRFRVFVHASREAERIRKTESKQFHGQFRRAEEQTHRLPHKSIPP